MDRIKRVLELMLRHYSRAKLSGHKIDLIAPVEIEIDQLLLIHLRRIANEVNRFAQDAVSEKLQCEAAFSFVRDVAYSDQYTKIDQLELLVRLGNLITSP